MKKILLMMLGLVAGTASFAHTVVPQSEPVQTHLAMDDRDRIRFYVQPLQTKGQLTIKDVDGRILHKQTVSLQKGLREQFDISNLSYGTYRLSLTTDHNIVTRTFVVQPAPNGNFIVQ